MDSFTLPRVARLEFTHGDISLIIEVPPEHCSYLIKPWTEMVLELTTAYRGGVYEPSQ